MISFKGYVEKVIEKIKPFVGILSRMKYYLHSQELKLIYYAYVHSNIHYLLPVCATCPKTDMGELEILHKRKKYFMATLIEKSS